MRKFLFALLALLLVLPLCLTGCGETKERDEGEEAEDEAVPAAAGGPRLAAFYDTLAEMGFLYRLDEKGQLYFLNFESESWVADGKPCPGKPPYDLAAFHNPDADTWGVLAVDGEGTLWHSTEDWDKVAKPIGTRGAYTLSAFYDTAAGEPIISTMTPDGKFYLFNGDNWELVNDKACPGDGPFDFVAFYDKTSDLYWTSAIDSTGAAYDLIMGEWVESGTPLAAEGPFRITGFHDVIADSYLFYVLDGEGELYAWKGDDWTKVGVRLPGQAPFDLDAFYDPDADAYYVMGLDSAGKVYQFTGDDWALQY